MQRATAQLLEAAFGDECAQRLLNVLASEELKAQQKLLGKLSEAKGVVNAKVGELIPPKIDQLL